ncbi:IclR family transcriptional regulator [Pseudonocardia sichuanensis]
MGAAERPAYFSPSVDTAARVLELLSRYRTRSATLSEIAAALGVSKTTCLRVVRTLVAHGLLAHDEHSKRYCLGYFAVVLGARAEEGLDTLHRVRPLLVEAARRTGLTAAFVQRVSQDRMMYVAKEQGGAAHLTVSVGNRFPVTSVSYGKWVLAFEDEDERDRLLADGLPRLTPHTRTDVAEYRAQVAALAPGDVVVSRNEYVNGVHAVSCPVLDPRGRLEGVLAVLGLSESLDEAEAGRVRDVMGDIAARTQR